MSARDRTVADAIHDYLAPDQPEDCKQATLEDLARALQVTGPVVHKGKVVSSTVEGDEHQVEFDENRLREHLAGLPKGEAGESPEQPADAGLSAAWSLPASADTHLPAKAIRQPKAH